MRAGDGNGPNTFEQACRSCRLQPGFVLHSLTLLGSLVFYCWICGVAGNLLHTSHATHVDWGNLLLAGSWGLLAVLAVTRQALFHWVVTYVPRALPRPVGVTLLIGCELLCGWLGWQSDRSFPPLPQYVSACVAFIGLYCAGSLLRLFLYLAWDRLQGPRSFRFEANRLDEKWKMRYHPSRFQRRRYETLRDWYDARQSVHAGIDSYDGLFIVRLLTAIQSILSE